jgi:hypothetical protein
VNRLVLAAALLVSSTVSGYQVRRSSSGDPLRWAEGDIVVELALGDAPSGVDAGEAARAAEGAFRTYTDALGPMQSRVGVAMSSRESGRSRASASDHVATVLWQHDGWEDDFDPDALAVTVTTYDPHSGRIDDADIVINATQSWAAGDDCSRAYDLQGVLAHEVGHLFGLAHDPDDRDATMYPSAGVCETKKRDLADSDLEGLEFLYINTEPPPPLACQAAPGSRPSRGAAVLAIAAVALALALRRRLPLVAAGAVLAFAAPAHATTIKKLELQAAGKAAGVALRGTVKATAARRIGDRIYTDVEIAVVECMKGRCGAQVTVRQLGGELDGEGITVAGTAEMRAGSEVVLLLRPRRDGTFAPVGMSQGVFHVQRAALVRDTRGLSFAEGGEGKVERVRLDDVRRALRD